MKERNGKKENNSQDGRHKGFGEQVLNARQWKRERENDRKKWLEKEKDTKILRKTKSDVKGANFGVWLVIRQIRLLD